MAALATSGLATWGLATLGLATLGITPACAKVRPQPGLLVLAPLGMVQGLGPMSRFHLSPRNAHKLTPLVPGAAPLTSDMATVADMRLAPKAVTQFAPAPAGMVNGVAVAGMVLPARLVDPVVAYQPRRRGPIVEFGVAGGGMKTRAGLAHVGMHWKF